MSETVLDINKFRDALETHAGAYQVELSPDTTGRLCHYYQLLSLWNPRLHLVAPCSSEEFARRHVLESLLALAQLPVAARIADVGSGGGLPIIPCLIARSDLTAMLIESSNKKAVFLREALKLTGKGASAKVIHDRFENVPTPEVEFVSCRALERFPEKLPTLVKWAPPSSTLLLFASEKFGDRIRDLGLSVAGTHIPFSESRFLLVVRHPWRPVVS